MKKIMFIFGTRPEAIKMAPVIVEAKKSPAFVVSVVVTAQHRTMLDQVLDFFQVTPDYDLDLMQENQPLSGITGLILSAVEKVIQEENPDVVLVHGDTTTTLAASIAAFYNKTPIGHIEAGLRSNNLYAPWPEEFNRRITDVITEFYFAPTEKSSANLSAEGVPAEKIVITGNTVIDALQLAVKKLQSNFPLQQKFCSVFNWIDPNKKMILVTGHRRENFGSGFENICLALREIAKRSDVQVVYPVHLNPNVRSIVGKSLQNIDNIFLIEPQDYPSFVYLLEKCYLVLTDSGGVQEEAPSLGKPVLVMREVTERVEAIEQGTARLVGTDTEQIVRGVKELLDLEASYLAMSESINPYGDGTAAAKIVKTLERY